MKKANDTQEDRPHVACDLQSVGVTNLRTIVETSWHGRIHRFVPTIEITVDLPKKKKGVHMSRLVESITEILEEEALESHGSFEDLARRVLVRLAGKHPYTNGRIHLATELVVPRKTPATGRETMETHDIEVEVSSCRGRFTKWLAVEVLGNSACPHALKNNDGITHVQRARGILDVETDYDNPVDLEDMIAVVESSFSSPVYTLLKSEDENHVVQEIFKNPVFVEDVARNILAGAKKAFKHCHIHVTAVSEESIHRHDVKAEASAST